MLLEGLTTATGEAVKEIVKKSVEETSKEITKEAFEKAFEDTLGELKDLPIDPQIKELTERVWTQLKPGRNINLFKDMLKLLRRPATITENAFIRELTKEQ